ncbi:SDR family oxidoreductase [Rossellomorea vietnamensis]|uniref:SDR family oxidoreductase n=1 Tax=Rossellomorea vietnamensis TaxID=218284 RepID=UPI003CF5A92B
MLLVTGITGHTGRFFLQELMENEYKGLIRCLVRETSDTTKLESSGLNIEIVVGDLNDSDFINRSMLGVNTVMHIYNIHHSPLIVKAAINHNVKRTILVHTTGIYSQFKNASVGYKNIEGDINELIKAPSCPTKVTILRPTMIYGDMCDSNMSKFIKMVDKFRIIPVINNGKSLIQPVNARDLGKAFYMVLMSPAQTSGKAYTLSGNKPIELIDVFKNISKELNKKTIFISVPLHLGVNMARFLKIMSFGKIDYVERVQRMGEDRSYLHDRAVKDFGYNPMSFEDGIQIEVKQYLEGL